MIGLTIALLGSVTPPAPSEPSFGVFATVGVVRVRPESTSAWGGRSAARLIRGLGPVDLREAGPTFGWNVEAGFVFFDVLEVGVAVQRFGFASSVELMAARDLEQRQDTQITSALGLLRLRTPELERFRLFGTLGIGADSVRLKRRGHLEDSFTQETNLGLRLGAGATMRVVSCLHLGFEAGVHELDLPSTHSLLPVEGGHDGGVTYVLPTIDLEWSF